MKVQKLKLALRTKTKNVCKDFLSGIKYRHKNNEIEAIPLTASVGSN